LIPDLGSVWARIEEVVHVFLYLSTKYIDGGPYKTPLQEIVPGENARVRDQPKEESDLRPVLEIPYFSPSFRG
jgi:hypothetical protein